MTLAWPLPRSAGRVRLEWLWLAGIYAAALLPAGLMAVTQPVWSRVDESQHADVLAQYGHGVWPVEGRTVLQPEVTAVDAATGVYRWYLPGAGPVPGDTDPAAFSPPLARAGELAGRIWVIRHLWGYSYEAMQPPLYYLLAEPAWRLGSDGGGVWGGIFAARLWSAAIAALLAPLTALLVLALRPGGRREALLGAGLAALLPGFVLNATQVTNDGLAAVLGAALTLVAVRGARDGWSPGRGLVAGLLLGAAALTKLTAVSLAPLLALALLWPDRRSPWRRISAAAVATLGCLAVVAPWLALNLHIYGQPVPTRATRALLGAVFLPPEHGLRYLLRSLKNVLAAFWVGEPYTVMPFTRQLAWLSFLWMAVAAAGLGLAWWRRRAGRLVWLLGLGVLGGVAWTLATPYLSGIGGLMPGRYLYPDAAAALALVVLGTAELPRLARLGLPAAGGAAATAALLLLATGHPGQVAGIEPVPAADAGARVSGQAAFAGVILRADRVAVSADRRVLWVHVVVHNQAPTAAEWNPTPSATAGGGETLSGDYAGSTPLPERLDPKAAVAGWIRLSRGSPVSSLHPLRLVFPDVAARGYLQLAYVTLDVGEPAAQPSGRGSVVGPSRTRPAGVSRTGSRRRLRAPPAL